ncbi:MAG: hypothetical protein NUV60_00235 [Patescibacteria group bacterium]|nr:hypothetical protein [Patescibacteria group bacterium]
MKKFLILIAVSFISFVPLALAQTQSGFIPLAPIPGLTDQSLTSAVNSDTLANFFNNLYKYLIGLAAAIAVIQIIWAGLDIAFFHKDAVSAITDDKGKIYNAIYGLILILSPVLVFSIINPNILNLSIGLPELDTVSGPPIQQNTTTVTPYIQQSVRPGSTRAIYNGQLIGFQEGPATTPQASTWCYPLASPQTNTDPALNGGQPYQATVFCARDSGGCRSFMNGSSGTPWVPATGAQCILTPP